MTSAGECQLAATQGKNPVSANCRHPFQKFASPTTGSKVQPTSPDSRGSRSKPGAHGFATRVGIGCTPCVCGSTAGSERLTRSDRRRKRLAVCMTSDRLDIRSPSSAAQRTPFGHRASAVSDFGFLVHASSKWRSLMLWTQLAIDLAKCVGMALIVGVTTPSALRWLSLGTSAYCLYQPSPSKLRMDPPLVSNRRATSKYRVVSARGPRGAAPA